MARSKRRRSPPSDATPLRQASPAPTASPKSSPVAPPSSSRRKTSGRGPRRPQRHVPVRPPPAQTTSGGSESPVAVSDSETTPGPSPTPSPPRARKASRRTTSPGVSTPPVADQPSPAPPPGTHDPAPSVFTPIFRDEAHEAAWDKIKARKVLPCRYFDDDVLMAYGFRQSVEDFMTSVHWSEFVQKKEVVYKELTLEFLSSLTSNLLTEPTAPCFIQFRIRGREYTVYLPEFRAIFGFSNQGPRDVPEWFDEQSAWKELTGNPQAVYIPKSSKASNLTDDALRYVHKMMSGTIFGRYGSDTVVTSDELYYLWSMVHGEASQTSCWLIRKWLRVMSRDSGPIGCGGPITTIARFLGIDLTGFTPIAGPSRLDMSTAARMNLRPRPPPPVRPTSAVDDEDNAAGNINRRRVFLALPAPPDVPVNSWGMLMERLENLHSTVATLNNQFHNLVTDLNPRYTHMRDCVNILAGEIRALRDQFPPPQRRRR